MANNKKTAFVSHKELFQNVHSKNIKVVGWFVQNKEVWIFQQQAYKEKALSFSAGEGAYWRILDFAFKAEFFQKLCGAYFFASVIQCHVFCGFFYVFKNCKACVFENRILCVIAELCIFTSFYGAGIWLEVAGNDIKEG